VVCGNDRGYWSRVFYLLGYGNSGYKSLKKGAKDGRYLYRLE